MDAELEIVRFVVVTRGHYVGVGGRTRQLDSVRSELLTTFKIFQLRGVSLRLRARKSAATALHFDRLVDEVVGEFKSGWIIEI